MKWIEMKRMELSSRDRLNPNRLNDRVQLRSTERLVAKQSNRNKECLMTFGNDCRNEMTARQEMQERAECWTGAEMGESRQAANESRLEGSKGCK